MLDTIPIGWAHCLIGDIAYLKNGFAFKSKSYLADGIPVIRISDIQDGVVTSENAVKVKPDKDFEGFSVLDGDVLIAMSGATTGKFGIYKSEKTAYQNQRVGNIKPHSKDIGKQFFFYFLYSAKKEIEKRAYGGAQPNISAEKIESIPFALPPFNEQIRIVAKIEELFSELDKGIESLKTAREQLKVYRQAVLKHAFEGKLTAQWREENKDELETANQLLVRIQKEHEARYQQQLIEWKAAVKAWEGKGKGGKKPVKPPKPLDSSRVIDDAINDLPQLPIGWVWSPLDVVAQAIDPQPSHRTPPKVSDGIPYVGVGDIDKKTGEFDFLSARKVSRSILDEHKDRYDINDGDFIIGKIGTIGKPFRIPCERFYSLSANVVLVKPGQPQINPKYLFSLCSSPIIEKQFDKGANATTQAAFGIKKVRTLMLPVCSEPEQREVLMALSRSLDVITQNETEIALALVRAETLRQSILKKAFSGQLVEQDPNDEPASVLLERIKAEKAAQAKDRKRTRKPKARRKEAI